MKIQILLLLFSINTIAQARLTYTAKGKPMLLGKTTVNDFNRKEFNWFTTNKDAYIVNKNVLKRCKDSLKNYKIKVFYGTWCGDSKRELPKFYKVLEQAKFAVKNIELIAVDKKQEAYKQAPNGEEKGLNIHRVPTFIFYKNKKEIGRIVEFPKEDFERDIFKIISRKKYMPNYAVVAYIDSLFTAKSLPELEKEKKELASYISEYTKGSRELNTYGYKLLRSKQLKKALFIFELNTLIYPYKAKVYSSYAMALKQAKKPKLALENYAKALVINPKNEKIIEAINDLIAQKRKNIEK